MADIEYCELCDGEVIRCHGCGDSSGHCVGHNTFKYNYITKKFYCWECFRKFECQGDRCSQISNPLPKCKCSCCNKMLDTCKLDCEFKTDRDTCVCTDCYNRNFDFTCAKCGIFQPDGVNIKCMVCKEPYCCSIMTDVDISPTLLLALVDRSKYPYVGRMAELVMCIGRACEKCLKDRTYKDIQLKEADIYGRIQNERAMNTPGFDPEKFKKDAEEFEKYHKERQEKRRAHKEAMAKAKAEGKAKAKAEAEG